MNNTKEYIDIGNIECVHKAIDLLDAFCSETSCLCCPIRRLCNKIDSQKSIKLGIEKYLEEIS